MLPTIITGLADDSTCMQEEIFGECAVMWHWFCNFGMAWHGMAWHGMAWHGMAWMI